MKNNKDKTKKPHYVNNKDFSLAICEYVKHRNDCKESNLPEPQIPNYIAESFLKICTGLSHAHNFVRYSFREEMIMDAVENCLRAIKNYDIEKTTRTKKPNAFGYFTQIAWFAFLRRIEGENKQRDIKLNYMVKMGIENFIHEDGENLSDLINNDNLIDTLRQRIDTVRDADKDFKEYQRDLKKQRRVKVDSDLSDFLYD